jgi:hypothetical protein
MFPVLTLQQVTTTWIDIKAEKFPTHGFLLFVKSDHFFPEYMDDGGMADLEGWTNGRCALFILHPPSLPWVDYTMSSDHIWWRLFGEKQLKQTRDLSLAAQERDRLFTAPTANLGLSGNTAYWSYDDAGTIRRAPGGATTSNPDPLLDENIQASLRAGKKFKQAEYKEPNAERALDRFRDISREPLLEIDGKSYSLAEVFAPRLNEFENAKEIQTILYRFNLKNTDHPCMVFFQDLSDKNVWFVDLSDLLDVPKTQLRAAIKEWFGGSEFQTLLKAKRASNS